MIIAMTLASPLSGFGAEAPVRVTIDLTSGPSNTFVPAVALGAGVDGHSRGDAAAIYRPTNLRAMRSVGLRPLSYRLRTELGVEAWHWNPRGRWSDSEHARGYWTSDDQPGAPILASFGYRLPRRGNTVDQAEDNGYSRLADGDLDTFWKSNPYLDRSFTGEDNSRHPQWLIVDLGTQTPVDAMRIAWGMPYAVRYQVQYWDGEDAALPDEYPSGHWQTFPEGEVRQGSGGDENLRLARHAVAVRYLRVLLEVSSGSPAPGAHDARDALGYAVREVYVGRSTRTTGCTMPYDTPPATTARPGCLCRRPTPGIAPRISIRRWSRPASTACSPVGLATACRCWFRSACCTTPRTTPLRSCATCGDALIRFAVLNWARNRMASTWRRKTTAPSTCR